MNNKKIEEIAVATIRNEILRNDFLSDEIPVNDKTPSWDGEIWVYNNKEQKKEHLIGRVPVQVKGRKVSEFSKDETKYSIKKVDLENYLKNGGILYFVIEIIDFDNTQIFYQSLLPIDIKVMLEEMGDKNSITKKFKKLPSTTRALEFITRNFIHHSNQQSLPLINDIKIGKFDAYTTKIIVPSRDKLEESLFEYGTYMYGRDEKLNLDVPLHKMDIEQIIEETNLKVGVNGEIIYNEVSRVLERDKITLKFGKSFAIDLPKNSINSKQLKIHFKEKGNIQDRIKDCSFMLELVRSKKIQLDKNEVSLNNFDQEEKFLIEMPKHIEYLEEVLETFNQLGVSFKVDFEKLTPDDINKINILKDTILYKNYEKLNLDENNRFLQFLIGDIHIILVSSKVNDAWLVFDLFDLDAINNNFKIEAVSGDDKQRVKHSPYLLFKIHDLFSFSNLKIDAIEASFKQVEYVNDFSFDLTNNFLLELLKYYDLNKQKTEILDLIINIYDYLNQYYPQNIFLFMNKMQALKRKREFSMEEKTAIINLKNNEQHSNEIMCGFYILLDSKMEFEVQFNKLTIDQKKSFKTYPIYNLIL